MGVGVSPNAKGKQITRGMGTGVRRCLCHYSVRIMNGSGGDKQHGWFRLVDYYTLTTDLLGSALLWSDITAKS